MKTNSEKSIQSFNEILGIKKIAQNTLNILSLF